MTTVGENTYCVYLLQYFFYILLLITALKVAKLYIREYNLYFHYCLEKRNILLHDYLI
jgi:hypothetical protein